MNFPDAKLSREDMEHWGLYHPPAPWSGLKSLLSPWPLKLGQPTLSVMRFHRKSCVAVTNNGEDACTCPQWKAYLRGQLRNVAKI
jgi:hypothetical protein